MPRIQPISAQAVDVALDLKAAFHELAMADGVITASEQQVADIIDRILHQVERIDRSRVIARNIEDHGGMSPWAQRMSRELERDLAPIINLEDYRRDTNSIA